MLVTVLPVAVCLRLRMEKTLSTVLKYAWTNRTLVTIIKRLLADRTLGYDDQGYVGGINSGDYDQVSVDRQNSGEDDQVSAGGQDSRDCDEACQNRPDDLSSSTEPCLNPDILEEIVRQTLRLYLYMHSSLRAVSRFLEILLNENHCLECTLFYCTFHAWVGWVSEIKNELIAAARGAFTS